MSLQRQIAALALLAGATIALSGCYPVLSGVTASQDRPADVITLLTTLCIGNATDEPGSVATACADDDDGSDSDVQILAGYLIPSDAIVTSVTLTGLLSGGMTPSPSFTSVLEDSDPAPAGRRWEGYRSERFPTVDTSGNPPWTVAARFRMPNGSEPFVTEFPYEARVSVRRPADEAEAAAPFDCEEPLDCIRIDGPLPGVSPTGTLALRDAILLGGQQAAADRGTRASVPFTLRYVGESPAGDLPLSATTTLPGATATPTPGTVNPGSSGDTPLTVDVEIPANAPPGEYPVTLRLPLTDDVVREATGTVVVRTPPLPVLDQPGVAFPLTRQDASAATQRLVLRNDGQQVLTLLAPRIAGPQASDFSVRPDACPVAGLGLGQTCGYVVGFRPAATGDRLASLLLPGDLAVPLTGFGAPTLSDLRTALRDIVLGSLRRGALLRRGLRFTQEFVLPGDATWALRLVPGGAGARAAQGRRVRIARAKRAKVTSVGSRRVVLRLNRSGRRAVKRNNRVGAVLTTRFVDALGGDVTVQRALFLGG